MTKFYHNESSRATLSALNDEIAEDLIPAMVYLGLLIIIGTVGNLLVCYIFLFRLRMGTQHFLIIALAVFDLLSCFIAMPTEIADMRHFMTFENQFACRLMRFVTSYCAFASILTLIVIAVDRYRKICHPLARQMSLTNAKVGLCIVLFVALLFAVPAPILYGIRSTDTQYPDIHGHDCSTSDDVQGTLFPLVYNSILFLAFIVILVTLTIIYVRIWREMKRHNRYMARNAKMSTFYLPSISEVSSPSEHPQHSRRRRGSDNKDCISTPAAVGIGKKRIFFGNSRSPNPKADEDFCEVDGQNGNDVRFGFGSCEIEAELELKRPSIHSDSTYCYDTDTESNSLKITWNRRGSSPRTITTSNGRPNTGIARVSSSVKSDEPCLPREPDLREISPIQYFSHLDEGGGEISQTPKGSTMNSDSLDTGSFTEVADTDSSKEKKQQQTVVFADEGIHDCDHALIVTAESEQTAACSDDKTGISDARDAADLRESHSTADDANEQESRSAEEETETADDCVKDSLEDQSTDKILSDARDAQDVVSGVQAGRDDDSFDNPPNLPEDLSTRPTLDATTSEGPHLTTAIPSTASFPENCSHPGSENTGSWRNRRPSLPSTITARNEETTADYSESRRMSLPTDMDRESETKTARDPKRQSLHATLLKPTEQPQDHVADKNNRNENNNSGKNSNGFVTDADAKAATANSSSSRDQRLTLKKSATAVKSYKATVIAMSVTVVFFLSFVPHLSLLTARIVHDFDTGLRGARLVLYNIFLRSYFINSVSNPIIYGVQNVRFRRECVRLLRGIPSCLRRKWNPTDG